MMESLVRGRTKETSETATMTSTVAGHHMSAILDQTQHHHQNSEGMKDRSMYVRLYTYGPGPGARLMARS